MKVKRNPEPTDSLNTEQYSLNFLNTDYELTKVNEKLFDYSIDSSSKIKVCNVSSEEFLVFYQSNE